jgi:acetyl-CoA carboxylase biotin carboxyl carrier protein
MTEHENQSQETSASPSDVVESVRDLIDMMMKGGIGELDLKAGDVKIRLRSESVALAAAAPVFSMPTAAMGYPAPQAIASQATEYALTSASTQAGPSTEGHVVTSPMIGTYYSASAPGEPAFVSVGDEVETGQVIGIIEAMKIMNEITADQSGVVVEIMVENAEAVEYGTPLIRVSSSARLD